MNPNGRLGSTCMCSTSNSSLVGLEGSTPEKAVMLAASNPLPLNRTSVFWTAMSSFSTSLVSLGKSAEEVVFSPANSLIPNRSVSAVNSVCVVLVNNGSVTLSEGDELVETTKRVLRKPAVSPYSISPSVMFASPHKAAQAAANTSPAGSLASPAIRWKSISAFDRTMTRL